MVLFFSFSHLSIFLGPWCLHNSLWWVMTQSFTKKYLLRTNHEASSPLSPIYSPAGETDVRQGRTKMVIWLQLWRMIQERRMRCYRGDSQLVWKLGKASLRKAVFKTFKPVADLVKIKGKRLEERGARERDRDQYVQRPRSRRDETYWGARGRPKWPECGQLQGWEWGGRQGLAEDKGRGRDLYHVLKGTI